MKENLKLEDTNIGVFAAFARKSFSFLNFLFQDKNLSIGFKKTLPKVCQHEIKKPL
jgi:hypothetical protein